MQAGWQGMSHAKNPSESALHVALMAALFLMIIYGVSNFGLRMRTLWVIFGLSIAAWNVTRRGASLAREEAA
jgi:hypothetical protein